MRPYLLVVSDEGGATVVTDLAWVEPEASSREVGGVRPPRRRWGWAIPLAALVVGVSLLSYVVTNETHVNTQFDQTHHALDVTRSRENATLANLTAVRRQLSVVNGQVSATSTALAQATVQLQGVQKSLASAQANVTDRTSTIGDLHTCLAGVEQALNALAVADQTHAIDALNGVSASCAGAVASDG